MDVYMPQLGETVTEGTITRWLKQVGDRVEADEPLYEVSTDKVDSEVPAGVAGVLVEIRVPEGETVPVGTLLAVIGDTSATTATPSAPEVSDTTVALEPPPPAVVAEPVEQVPEEPVAEAMSPAAGIVEEAAAPPGAAPAPPEPAVVAGSARLTSPVVRRLLSEFGLDPSAVRGTGEGGRITRKDVLDAAAAARAGAGPAPAPARPAPAPARPAPAPRAGGVIPFSNIRRRTAEHMVRSRATSAHAYTSVEVDFERITRVRAAHRDEWRAREGFSLTYLPFIARAVSDTIDDFPIVNASVEGESLVLHPDLHLAIAVDLQFEGLVAPVIRNADGKRLRQLAREIHDLATRARSKQLSPDEVVGGTFTITNPGPYGTYQTLAIINQPQVAILATDGITKRAVVVEGADGGDVIALRHTGLLTLGWDHRAFDGAYAAAFLGAMREVLQSRDWETELE
jgi:2-oxoglutarate dehydrogenase E2 component (dihydrolipoamide succinyltransferase)